MLLMGPPEGILLQDLVLLEVLSNPPALIISKRQPILLEKSINSWNASVPRVLKVLQRQPPVLLLSLLPLESILSPDSLTIDELALPRLDVPVQVRNQLILLMGHARSKVRNAGICLLRVTQILLRYKDMSH